MEMHILSQGVLELPKLHIDPNSVIDLMSNESMTVVVMEKGMASGAPSVVIVSQNPGGTVMLQTSLDKFLMAAAGMKAVAESRFGWVQPEGTFSILPPDRETRRALLESIKKELEEWEEVDDVSN